MSILSAILQILQQPWPWRDIAITIFVIIIVTAPWISWKASAWKTTTDLRLKNLEKAIKKIPKELELMVKMEISKSVHSVDESTSPRKLNEYGRELSKKIDAGKIAALYTERLYEETKDMNPYYTQEQCFIFCMDKLMDCLEQDDKESFNKISTVAYEEGVEIERLWWVVGLELRDKVLAMKSKAHAAEVAVN